MENQKNNVAVIAVIIVIVALTAGVFGWMFAKKAEAPVQQAIITQSAPVAKTQPAVQPTSQTVSVVPASWKTYADSKYGFELKTPTELTPFAGGGSQVVMGDPVISVITNVSDPSKNPYGDAPYATEPQITLNGITWHVFHNSEGGMQECDSATFQTLMPNGKDVIYISTIDENHCPGNPKEAPSVVLLKQILSTFKFTK